MASKGGRSGLGIYFPERLAWVHAELLKYAQDTGMSVSAAFWSLVRSGLDGEKV